MSELKTVLRFEKIKSFNQLNKSGAHIHRYMNETKNADKNKKHLNKVFIGSGNLTQDLKNKLSEKQISKIRKNGVICVEAILSLTNESFKNKDDLKTFVKQANLFLKKEFGDNIISFVLHLDESTPHIHAHILPVEIDKKKGGYKLNARDLFNRNNLKKYQKSYCDFMKKVNSNITYKEGSVSKHQTLKEYYAIVNNETNSLKLQKEAVEIENKKLKEEIEIQNQKIKKLENVVKKQNKKISKLKEYILKIETMFKKLSNKNKDKKDKQEQKLKYTPEIEIKDDIDEAYKNSLNDFLNKKELSIELSEKKNAIKPKNNFRI
ncbi:MobV family relaxase [Photobacterium piscicola]|uniref:MobV family relaxase n=1 Tax=Photobacterium piscicola TaxID=1378299 RepID=A0ABU6LDK3_9GAMM|nr:MobV family relaxase [Photobacterium piscicola]